MADRVISPPGGSGDSDRPQTTRASSDFDEQTKAIPGTGGQRSQTARGGSGQRIQSARSSPVYGERRPAGPRAAGGSGTRRASPRRVDVIRCENCGEDYNVSYKRCPFCDERPGRGGVAGKRVSNTRGGGYGRPVNPVQIAGLVISLVLIASALFIVIRFLGAPLFGGKNNSPGSDVSTSQGNQPATGTPGGTVTPGQTVQSIALNETDLSLDNAATYQLTASLLPEGAAGEVAWSSSDSTAAVVDSAGLVTNVNTGNSDVTVTITAACGDVTSSITVTCKGKAGGGAVASGTTGRVVNARNGLNIRSGPGTNYEKVASATNGATVTILGEENGFYKIYYSGDKIGYASKDYISVG